MKYKQYKDLTINERINAKSFGFWRLPNKEGFLMTMIDNALSFKREDFYDYTMHTTFEHYDAPKLQENTTFKPDTDTKKVIEEKRYKPL